MSINDMMPFGLEAIKIQDDSFTEDMLKAIRDIQEAAEFYGIKGKDIYKNTLISPKLKAMDKLVTKRFGLTVNFVYGGKNVMGYLKIPPVVDTGLDTNFGKTFDMLKKKRVEASDTEGNRVLNKRLMSDLSKSQEELQKYVKKNKIVIDREKAYITGIPKNIIHHIAIDWDNTMGGTTFGMKGLKDKELLAIILHELGHMFTWQEFGYKQTRNTVNLVESFKNIKNPNGFKKVIDKTGNELGLDMKTIKDDGKVAAVIQKLASNNPDNVHFHKDSEALADQFATRFGLGVELVTALTKITKQNDSAVTLVWYWYLTRTIIVSILVTIITGSLAFGAFAFAYIISINQIVALFIGIAIGSIFNQKTSEWSYDTLADRFTRIKQDLLRQVNILDTEGADDSKILSLIEEVDFIDKSMQYARTKNSLGEEISARIFNGGKLNYSLLEKDLEALEANPLIALKHKLKKVQGL